VHCRRFLTGYKVPRHVEFVPSLPKTAIGKILRRELRQPRDADSLREPAPAAEAGNTSAGAG
ncbi:MAG TPA: hypothetical protein VMB71_07430, partial [Acetobacteraceae bacterium]|nr:hypothetical protein [Acetobacteraceae bacterium]